MKTNWGDAIPLAGIGILGVIHEFIISDAAEYFPLILFGLLIVKALELGFRKK
ncbi:MAG: hypothetical protein ISR91_04135 [Candidatus Delongbacteria bacterium]|nr:hypothetical protein [Candidatus Delongbacteria bacterium]